MMDIEHLFNNPLFSDIRVIIAGQSYHAHKMILGTKSEYFRTKFCTLLGNNSNEDIIIDDYEFLNVLRFMYCPSLCPITKDNMETLAKYADMYLIEGLKKVIDVWLAQLDYSFDNCILRIELSNNDPHVIYNCINKCPQMTAFVTNLNDDIFSRLLPLIIEKPANNYKIVGEVVTPRFIKWLETAETLDIDILYNALRLIHFNIDSNYESLAKLKVTASSFKTLIKKASQIMHHDPFCYNLVPYHLEYAIVESVMAELAHRDKILYDISIIMKEKFKQSNTLIDYYSWLFRALCKD